MKKLFTILLIFFSIIAFAQSDSIAYSHEYEFSEGVFLTVSQLLQNNPIPKAYIVSNIPKTQPDFLKQVMEQQYFMFKDSAGKEQKLETSTIWGYCQNRSVYINFNKEFNRLVVIGTLCYFTARVVTNIGFHDPMGYNSMNNTSDELRQFVFNTRTNKVLDFDANNMEMLLKNDGVLYNKFTALKKREKPDAIFVYLRKYNENHPLYLPAK